MFMVGFGGIAARTSQRGHFSHAMTWQSPEVLLRQLQALDGPRFAELCNELLSSAAATASIPRDRLALNHAVAEPDGGIDARCIDAPLVGGRLFPRQRVDYQYKAGMTPRSADLIAKIDILAKPRVVAGLKAGHAFVFLAARDRADNIEQSVRARLQEDGLPVDDDQIVYVGGAALVQLMTSFPAIVARFLGLDGSDIVAFEEWAAFPSLSNPFQADENVEARVRELRGAIEGRSSTTRLVGAAGDGKTRLVMEALRGSDVQDCVLYAKDRGAISPQLLSHLRRTPDVRCTLVVDEVDEGDAVDLIDRLEGRNENVRLVMIGLDAARRADPAMYQVAGLDEPLLSKIVTTIASGIPDEAASAIARDCERSPKLAVLLAGRVRANPALVRSTLLRDAGLRSALDTYLDVDPTRPEWKALSAAALLTRLGWSGAVETESSILFKSVGLVPRDARSFVHSLNERYGIAPIAGRYRYVSPAILADHLAAKELTGWTREDVSKVLGSFTHAMAESFSRRAARLAASLDNAESIALALFGDEGPFRDLKAVEDSGLSFFLRALAAPLPLPTLRALDRCIGTASHEELLAAKESRRDMVVALEAMLWRADMFATASRLLLKLAIAENESWSNNASGLWTETFQTMLGRTAAGWRARADVLRDAARREEPQARVLAANAMRSAFKTGSTTRMGQPPQDVEGMPSDAWRPATYGEWWESLIAYVDIVELLITDRASEVRLAAVEAITELAQSAFRVDLRVVERWRAAASGVASLAYEERRPLIGGLRWALRRWKERAEGLQTAVRDSSSDSDGAGESGGERESAAGEREYILQRLPLLDSVLRAIEGTDFSSRLRAALESRDYSQDAAESEATEERLNANLRALAREGLGMPETLDRELGWLVLSDKAWRVDWWIRMLAELDDDEIAISTIDRLATKSARAVGWRSVYVIARAERQNDQNLIDRRAESLLSSQDASGAFDLLLRAGYTPQRLDLLLRALQGPGIDPNNIGRLAYLPLTRELPVAEAHRTITTAADSGASTTALVTVIGAYLQDHPEHAETLSDVVLAILSRPPEKLDSNDTPYQWDYLAKMFAPRAPEVVGRAALGRLMAGISKHSESVDDVLREAWDASDKTRFFWEVIAPFLEQKGVNSYFAREILSEIPLNEVGADVLLQWVETDPEEHAFALASALGAPGNPVPDIHALLLERYGERAGAAFRSRFMTGTFWGSAVDWTRGKLEIARHWAADPRPAVAEWGRQFVVDLERSLRHEEAREAEERLES